MGSLVAARLALAQCDVTLYGRPSPHLAHVERHGLTLEDAAGPARNVALSVTTEPATVRGADLIVLLVKTWATAAALAPLRDHLPPTTTVLTLQNGLGNAAAIRSALGDTGLDVLLGVTTQGALRPAIGRVRNTGSGACAIGREGGGLERPLGAVVAAFTVAGLDAFAVADIERWVWRKLAINAAINPLTALIGAPNRAIANDPDLRRAAVTLAEEVAAVARARGLELDDPVEAALAVAVATGANRSSMRRDLEQGQPTEIEAINGAVVAEAERLGVATPANRLVANLIRARERTMRTATNEREGDDQR